MSIGLKAEMPMLLRDLRYLRALLLYNLQQPTMHNS
jgi:hypothetical protein